jgi:type II secretory pathway pseudopilin PulG
MRQAGWHIQPTREGGFYVTRNPQAHQQNYQSQLDQRVAAIEQATQQQQVYQRQQIEAYQQQQQQIAAENTERMLGQWAEGREHFDDVRVLMGHLLSPDPQTGIAPIPLKSDGTVDLETAYRWAVRAKFGDRVAADQEYATKARRKASSLTNSAPGRNNGGSRQREKALGTSVRDDIKAAIREVSDR